MACEAAAAGRGGLREKGKGIEGGGGVLKWVMRTTWLMETTWVCWYNLYVVVVENSWNNDCG